MLLDTARLDLVTPPDAFTPLLCGCGKLDFPQPMRSHLDASPKCVAMLTAQLSGAVPGTSTRAVSGEIELQTQRSFGLQVPLMSSDCLMSSDGL